MGPSAGIHLQKLIVDATKASRDQDHLEVLCFTNPRIPDRTTSLEADDGEEYVRAIIESLHSLHRGGATLAVIPCNTSHARIDRIQAESPIPVINLIDTALRAIRDRIGSGGTLGLLATRGTIRSGVYPASELGREFIWVLPSNADEEELMEIIYGVKAGQTERVVERTIAVANALTARGADAVLLGCTELSIYADDLGQVTNATIFDPLKSMATYLVELSGKRITPS